MPAESTAYKQATTKLSVDRIKGVGPAMKIKLAKLGIHSILDLLFHLPVRYEDRTRIQTIASLKNLQSALLHVEVIESKIVFGKRRSLVCKVADHTGFLTLRFFYFSSAQKNQLSQGTHISCFGQCRVGKQGLELVHPEYQLVSTDKPTVETDKLTAIYPSTEGINQARWRAFIKQAFAQVKPCDLIEVFDQQLLPPLLETKDLFLPTTFFSDYSLYETLQFLHSPPNTINYSELLAGTHPAQQRLAFEELVAQRLLHLAQKETQQTKTALPIASNESSEKAFKQQLPFTLTQAQCRVLATIKNDLSQNRPMLRLLQGDVGSGKTIVAAIAALLCCNSGLQVALMAPTEILAEQHYTNFIQWFDAFDINITLLVSKMTAPVKRESLNSAANGSSQIIIGTHALIQDNVVFNNLGLVIIDEQHRFGVEQRLSLNNKRDDGNAVHQLVMTATPIPRTLAMTFYAYLNYSVIDELPSGRLPIETVAIDNQQREKVVQRIAHACSEGRQVYWVCTLIEESEVLQCQAAETTASELSALMPQINIGLIHGRLKSAQKKWVMDAFKSGEIDLLVATTVIEVGVDVPNATLMTIENPERLGLAQLHQLRGRVGRGSQQSHCVLLYKKPLSKNAKQRIDALRKTNDGFALAKTDLKLRGPGEVLGIKQSGAPLFKIADLERDSELIDAAVFASEFIFERDANKTRILIDRWCAQSEQYRNV